MLAINYAIEPIYPGLKVQIHKKGNIIKIFDSYDNDLSQLFHEELSAISSISRHNFIIECTFLPYFNRKTVNQEVLNAYLLHNEDYIDLEIKYVFLVQDCLYLSKDLTKTPFFERKTLLNTFRYNNLIKRIDSIICYSKVEILDILDICSIIPGAMGARILPHKFIYSSGMSKDYYYWVK